MSERLSLMKRAAAGTVLVLGAAGLTGCAGESVTESFTYAVDCDGKDIDVTKTEVDFRDNASIVFDCEGDAPESVNLVGGGDVKIVEPENGDESIIVTADNVSGDLRVSSDMKSQTEILGTEAHITISGVSEIDSVVVGNQNIG